MTCTVGGTAPSQDFSNLKVWYSTLSTFSAGTSTLLSTLANTSNGGVVTFPSFVPQLIPGGTTGYIYITADGAGQNRSIQIFALTPADFTFSLAGLVATGSTTDGGLKQSCDIGLSDNAPQVTAGSAFKGTTVLLHQAMLTNGTVSTQVLSVLSCTTVGNYTSADITNLKAWYQTTQVYSGVGTLLTTLTTPGTAGNKTFPGFTSPTIATGASVYIFITADIAAGATTGDSINVNGLTTSNFTLTPGNFYGSTTNGGVKKIAVCIAPSSPVASNNSPVCAGTSLTLSSAASGSIVMYSWAGPNSYTAYVQNPTVSTAATAAMAGTYTVTISSCGSVTATTSVIVNPLPTPTITPDGPTNFCSLSGSVTLASSAGYYVLMEPGRSYHFKYLCNQQRQLFSNCQRCKRMFWYITGNCSIVQCKYCSDYYAWRANNFLRGRKRNAYFFFSQRLSLEPRRCHHFIYCGYRQRKLFCDSSKRGWM